jgi:hypothetical protein
MVQEIPGMVKTGLGAAAHTTRTLWQRWRGTPVSTQGSLLKKQFNAALDQIHDSLAASQKLRNSKRVAQARNTWLALPAEDIFRSVHNIIPPRSQFLKKKHRIRLHKKLIVVQMSYSLPKMQKMIEEKLGVPVHLVNGMTNRERRSNNYIYGNLDNHDLFSATRRQFQKRGITGLIAGGHGHGFGRNWKISVDRENRPWFSSELTPSNTRDIPVSQLVSAHPELGGKVCVQTCSDAMYTFFKSPLSGKIYAPGDKEVLLDPISFEADIREYYEDMDMEIPGDISSLLQHTIQERGFDFDLTTGTITRRLQQ